MNGGAAGTNALPTGASTAIVAGGGGGGCGGNGGFTATPSLAGSVGFSLQTVTPNPENIFL